MAVSLASLLVQETKDAIYQKALQIASLIGLPVTSWQAGDPTRALFFLEAETLAALESLVVGFISSGFLDYASGDWLVILAQQVFGVVVPDATFATTDVTLTNTGGGVYDISPNDLTFRDSSTGKTYHNTTGGHLGGSPATLTVTVEADEAGSSSSAGAGDIDDLVTVLLGVTCSNANAAVGVDRLDDATIRQQCRDMRGSLSPNGPKDAYSFVARNSALTGTANITRVRVYPDSDTGDVTVYLAGPSGAVAGPDVTAVTNAIVTRATPLCITPTVLSANAVTVDVTYTVYCYKSVNKTAQEVQDAIFAALGDMFAERPIGGDIIPPATSGYLYSSIIEATIRGTFDQIFRVDLTLPTVDTPLTNDQVVALGTVLPNVVFVSDP